MRRRLRRTFSRSRFKDLDGRFSYDPHAKNLRRQEKYRRKARPGRRLRRVLILGGVGLVVATGAATVDAYVYSIRAVDGLREAADGLSAARNALVRGELPDTDRFAQAAIKTAEVRAMFEDARPTLGVVGFLPFVNRPVVAVRELLEATEAEVRAATQAQALLEELLGGPLAADQQEPAPEDEGTGTEEEGEEATPGPSAEEQAALKECEKLSGKERQECREKAREEFGVGVGQDPTAETGQGDGGGQGATPEPGVQTPIFADGSFDLDRIASYVPRLEAILEDLRAAEAAVNEVPTAPFVDKVDELKADILEDVVQARILGENALEGLRALPILLGADRPRYYFVAFGDLSYLRGAGGSTLAFAVLKADDGAIEVTEAEQVFRILDDQVDYDVPVPEDNWYLHEGKLRKRLGNANWSPHFPSSGSVMGALYELVAEQQGFQVQDIDGVIQIDAQGLASMMKAFGNVTVPQWPDAITTRNVAEVAYIDSHIQLTGRERKAMAASLVEEVWDRLGNPRDAQSFLSAVVGLGNSLARKNVQVWLEDPAEQALASKLGWTGEIRDEPGDYLYLAEDNQETDALDFFARQTIHHDVTILEDGSLEVTTKVELTVELPEGEEYRTPPIASPRGPTKKTMVNLYVPEGAELVDVLYDDARGRGSEPDVQQHVEQGRRVFTATLRSPPNQATSMIFRYTVPDALVQVRGGPAYRLVIQAQPRIVSDELVLTLHLPEGATTREDIPRDWLVDGNVVTIEERVARDQVIEVLFTG
ncbi:MAG: DUF4012 domain-containing protein [Actinobacteria bacterium]|nr:DUF4012 domain-containing protein [Actinomycetota bacterium]